MWIMSMLRERRLSSCLTPVGWDTWSFFCDRELKLTPFQDRGWMFMNTVSTGPNTQIKPWFYFCMRLEKPWAAKEWICFGHVLTFSIHASNISAERRSENIYWNWIHTRICLAGYRGSGFRNHWLIICSTTLRFSHSKYFALVKKS